MTIAKIDNRTRPERQAARIMGVALDIAITEVRVTYGADRSFTQAWRTQDGRVLVFSASDKALSATVVPVNFDWTECLHDESANYDALASAAGIVAHGDLADALAEERKRAAWLA